MPVNSRLLRSCWPRPEALRHSTPNESSEPILDTGIRALLPSARQALLDGRCPVPELACITVNRTTRLRYLDKRMDLLTFFRFADPASCCWNSTGSNFATTQSRLLAIWKVPLSFCFHLARMTSGNEPIGFVFGSLARVDEAPAVLLNGLYLRRQLPAVRAAALRGLERFFRHLGVRWMGVASRYGGIGTMPGRYRYGSRKEFRPRALRVNGKMVTHTQSLSLYRADLGTGVSAECQ